MGAELSRMWQPDQKAVAVAFAGAVTAVAVYYPDQSEAPTSQLTKFLHLGSFATWLGTQFWVTFIAGK